MGCLQIHVVDSELGLPPLLLREPVLPEEILPTCSEGKVSLECLAR